MKKCMALLTLVFVLSFGSPVLASEDVSHEVHTGQENMQMNNSGTMEHAALAGTFTHQEVVQDIRIEFWIMSLASMNMKDPDGATHHIMVKIFHNDMNHQIKDTTGKIKVINPSGKEQTGSLKNYNGVFAANFIFNEKGKYGVICMFKMDERKLLTRFWYPYE